MKNALVFYRFNGYNKYNHNEKERLLMQKTATKAKSSSSYTRPKLQKSVTLSRKYVRKPSAKKVMDIRKSNSKVAVKAKTKIAISEKADNEVLVKKVAKIPIKAPAKVEKVESKKVAFKAKAKASDLKAAISASSKTAPIKSKEIKRVAAINRFSNKSAATKPVVAKEKKPVLPAKTNVKKLFSKSVKSASASKASSDAARLAMQKVASMDSPVKPMKKHRKARFFIAIGCSAAAIAGLVAFVVVNIPNISVKVAAMQTGIDAEYPDYVPRNYSLETVSSDKNEKITMKFAGPGDAYFILTEENSTWDSTAVLNNYVKQNYSANYSTMHEQGITYYSETGAAAWVNGGILYKLTSYGKNLTKEQIRNLVVSL